MKIDLLAIYEKQEHKDIEFAYDKKSQERPAWIKMIKPKITSGFLRVRINDLAEEVYRSFGSYFYPWNATPEEEKKFYAGVSQDYDTVVAQNNMAWAKNLAEKLKKASLKKDAKIIDLGAGTGIASEVLAEKGYQNLTLVDLSPQMLAVAKKKPKLAKAKFLATDIQKLSLKEKYDGVISVMLFDKFETDKKLALVLKKVKKIMKVGALIGLIEDNQKSLYSQFFQKIEEGVIAVKPLSITCYFFIGRKTT